MLFFTIQVEIRIKKMENKGKTHLGKFNLDLIELGLICCGVSDFKKSLILGTLGEYLEVTFTSLFKPYKKRFLQEKEKKRKGLHTSLVKQLTLGKGEQS